MEHKLEKRHLLYAGIAALCGLFTFSHISIPFMEWIQLIFVVRFFRTITKKRHFLILWAVIVPVTFFASYGMLPLPGIAALIFLAISTLISFLPFLADRFLNKRFNGFAGTLIFPALVTGWYFIDTFLNAFGSWGSIVYSQISLPFMLGLASFGGMWPIIFIMAWIAGVVNYFWEQGWDFQAGKAKIVVFAAVLMIFFGLGFTGALIPLNQTASVPVASVIPSNVPSIEYVKKNPEIQKLFTRSGLTENEIQKVSNFFTAGVEDMFFYTQKAAEDGNKIIFWPEGSVMAFADTEEDLLEKGKKISREYGVYLGLSYALWSKKGDITEQFNKNSLISPQGDILWDYTKTYLVPMAEDQVFTPGDGNIVFADTPYGRIGTAICHDLDHHQFAALAGKNNIDILFVPTGDWKGIEYSHLDMVRTRAVEQGLTIVRVTKGGISAVIDPKGRVVDSYNRADVHFDQSVVDPQGSTETVVFSSEVPVFENPSVYRSVGDTFAFICLAGLVIGVITGLIRKKKVKQTKVMEKEVEVVK